MEIIDKILQGRQHQKPTGEPLYTYKLTDEEFVALKAELRELVRIHEQITGSMAAGLCLYGSEYFSRSDGRAWWTYDGIRKELDLTVPDSELRSAIAFGLGYWGRKVLRGEDRDEYLGTLVSEGGLPLALLRDDDGRVRRYFFELLRQHETFPDSDIERLASELESILPMRMRNVVVRGLATKLISAVAHMRSSGSILDAATARALPVRLDDEVGAALLKGLQSAPTTGSLGVGITVLTLLQRADEFLLRRRLNFPPRLASEWLQNQLNVKDLPARLYLSLETADGARQTVGIATLQGAHYLVRSVSARDVVRARAVLEQLRCIVSFGDNDLGSFVPVGGEALPESPWTFSDDCPEGEFLSAGSLRTRAGSVVVALPEGSGEVQGTVEELKPLVGLNRRVVRVTERIAWGYGDDRAVIAVSEQTDDAVAFELRGSRPAGFVLDSDLWLGVPTLNEISENGVRKAVSSDQLQWRRPKAPWQQGARNALGTCDLRYVASGRDFRSTVRILPKDFEVQLRCVGPDRGAVSLSGARIVDVGLVAGNAVRAMVRKDGARFEVDIVANDAKLVPRTIALALRLDVGTHISLDVPFPARFVGFIGRHGAPLEPKAEVSLNELAHVRAQAISPQTQHWAIDFAGSNGAERLAGLRDLGGAVSELHLEPLRPALTAILASAADLDHFVELSLVQEGGVVGRAPGIRVRRYDSVLEPRTKPNVVTLDASSLARMGPEIVAAMRAEAVPLAHPDASPVPLVREEPGRWSLDASALSPGVWLVLAYQGDYLRSRPLRITVPGASIPDATSAVEAAMAEPRASVRAERLREAVERLPNDTSDPDWDVVRAQVGTLGRYPSATFDLVRAIARCPRAAILALLDGGTRAEKLWFGFEELPLLWAAFPLKAWLEAIVGYSCAVRDRLPPGLSPENVLRDAAPGIFGAAKLAPFLACIHDACYLQAGLPIPPPTERTVFMAGSRVMRERYADLLLGEEDEGMEAGFSAPSLLALNRRHANDTWPEASPWPEVEGPTKELEFLEERLLTEQSKFKHTVISTPLRLAREVVLGHPIDDLLRLRRLRDFDPDWFDVAYSASLGCLLGQRWERKDWPFNE